MKKYLNKDWLFAEYVIKGKSTITIARENGCTDTNILRVMRRFNIPRRNRNWTQVEDMVIQEFAKDHTLIEIAEMIDKTYEAVRIRASKLGVKSAYKPGIRDVTTRRKISASLQGIPSEAWNGFKETENSLIRKSVAYQEWRKTVFDRDDYTCQACQARSGLGRKVYLHADHIKQFALYPDLRLDINNGRTLCVDCHRKTETWGRLRKVFV